MEKLYKKNEDGTYEDAGYINVPDLYDGIWLVQNHPHSRSKSSLVWRVGDLKRPADITTHAAFYSIADDIAGYMVKLTKHDSDEFIEAKIELGDWIKANNEEGIGVYNISAQDYAMLILNKIATYFEDAIDPPSLYTVTREFVRENPDSGMMVNRLDDYLEKNNFIIKKKHK